MDNEYGIDEDYEAMVADIGKSDPIEKEEDNSDATCKAVRNSKKSNVVWQSPDYKGYPSYGPRGDGKWGCTGGP